MEIEDLLTLYAMLGGISDPVRKLANVHSKIQRAAAASDRICALMDRRPEVADKPKADPPRLPSPRGDRVRLEVGFGYNGREPVLHGFEPRGPPRRDDRAGRPERLRQVHVDEPPAPVLGRPKSGVDPDRRPRHPRRPGSGASARRSGW